MFPLSKIIYIYFIKKSDALQCIIFHQVKNQTAVSGG